MLNEKMTQLDLDFKKQNSKQKKQAQLLQYCIDSGVPLEEALAEIGWRYDDLQYVQNYQPAQDNNYYPLSHFNKSNRSIPVVSFFAGAGGLDLGFEAAGFSHVALIEKNELFCETLRRNRPHWTVLGPPNFSGDVSKTQEIVSQLEPRLGCAPFEGVFVGGPPCQPFSIAANQRFNKAGDNFKRVGFAHATNGNLLFDYIELIKRFRPSAFLIENVPGLIEVDGGEQLQKAYADLEKVGYTLADPTVLIASEHFVPQNRTRLFIVGSRTGRKYVPPAPINKQLNCSGVFQLPLENVENHITRKHSAESIERYVKLDLGERDQLGRVDRLDPRLPSKTVIAGGTAGGGRSHLHPYIPRTLSVRECARIQTFPDDYIFYGPVARQFTQVGNAVPPVLAAQLAESLFQSIFL